MKAIFHWYREATCTSYLNHLPETQVGKSGPGSSTVGIKKDNNRCLINWTQHAWVDEKTKEHSQSSQIKVIVQCSPK